LAHNKLTRICHQPSLWIRIALHFFQGFVLVKDFFEPHRLDVVREAVNELVDILAEKLYAAGKIKSMLGFVFSGPLLESSLAIK